MKEGQYTTIQRITKECWSDKESKVGIHTSNIDSNKASNRQNKNTTKSPNKSNYAGNSLSGFNMAISHSHMCK